MYLLGNLILAVGTYSPGDHIGAVDREALALIGGDTFCAEVRILDTIALDANQVMMGAGCRVEAGWSRSEEKCLHLAYRYQGMKRLVDRLQGYGWEIGPDPVED